MLKLGEKIIKDIYLGDKKIAKVFLGDKLVYQANKPIFLDYIDSDGNNCIDSGIECTSDLKIEFKGSCSNNANQACCGGIGLQNAPTYFRYHWTPGGGLIGFWCQNDAKTMASINGSHPMGKVAEVTIDAPNGIAIVNGKKYTFTKLEKGLTTGKNFGVFGRISSKGDIQSKPSRFYYFKIYKNDILMRDLRPCIDPKGVVCMYDMVTQKYHYNIGTGTLTAGNVIKFVDYVESDGNCYINTNVFADNTYTFDTTVAFVKENYNCVPWGVRTSGNYVTENSQCYLNTNTQNNISIIKLYSTSTSLATNWSSGIIPEIDKVYELKGMTVVPTMTTMKYPIILFGLNNIGTINTSVGMCRIYKWTAYSNGVVVRDLRPCVVAGEACFYDMVTGNLFYNKGTGKLGYMEK